MRNEATQEIAIGLQGTKQPRGEPDQVFEELKAIRWEMLHEKSLPDYPKFWNHASGISDDDMIEKWGKW